MDITEVSIIHHVGIVFLVIWLLTSFNYCNSNDPIVYFVSLIYLYLVHENFSTRFRRKVRFEERRQASQKRVLSDSESVRWLNHMVEKIWPICMENIVSQKVLLPIIPWFLEKYKPWTVKEAMVQKLYMGRSPPMITEMRVCRQSTGDDHLVLELGLNFRTADDMSAILAVKLTKRLGFGMLAKMHLTGMHVEGKVLVGVKFLPKWPFLGRVRLCFVEPPYFQMTVKPMFAHGLDVTEVPGIAGWLDKLLTVAFEETLVEPNMLVVDVEKFISPEAETWFSVDAKDPVAYTLVEVVEGTDMKPSDMNGLADPYVKGQIGAYRFRTKIKRKTLTPKWLEEFKIPITSWDSPNILDIEVRDKDHFIDDTLGNCCIKINDFRDGERHDIWLPLRNIKMGRLHLAVRVIELEGKVIEQPCDEDALKSEDEKNSFAVEKGEGTGKLPEKSKQVMADDYEPIDVEGQRETAIWVQRPGDEVAQVWEQRKGKNRVRKDGESLNSSIRSESYPNDSSSTDESLEGNKTKSRNPVKRGFRKIGSLFHRSPKAAEDDKSRTVNEDCDSPRQNVRAVNAKGIGVKLVMPTDPDQDSGVGLEESPEGSDQESPEKRKVKDKVKGILKHTGNSARGMIHALSRKGSDKEKNVDSPVQSDYSGAGSSPSPEFRPKGLVIPDVSDTRRINSSSKSEDEPDQNDASKTATSPFSQTGEVKEEDDPNKITMDAVDVNATDTCDPGTMIQGTADPGAVIQGTADPGAMIQGTPDPGTMIQGTPDSGTMTHETPLEFTGDQVTSSPSLK
ncbi:C2 domain-containing protein At1g53590-like isoform X1 [Cynara cardunculus var. scolymus]|uniref:C2 domain-containing protein At1g53590-like isoform X1 n=2 Tax=Cynara cardunculus var. scolymus TaxID=59895 RepID=UPI000D62A380|nr:C2 domain-containing protein At1g53590-like isoform X1 [Cynara cardunculus var. scolymus]